MSRPPAAGSVTLGLLALFSVLFGAGSLLLLSLFLVTGPFDLIDLGVGTAVSLLIDAALCLAFFLQHSLMVRRAFRRRLSGWVRTELHPALYSIASGAVLLLLLVFWQSTDETLYRAGGAMGVLPRLLVLAGLAGFIWGAAALGSFDSLGLESISRLSRRRPPPQPAFVIRGPYRWVRHPLYTAALLLIWGVPELTVDRLTFNVLWTAWVAVGARLEERDLVSTFGPPYAEYQRRVPMLIPFLPRPTRPSRPGHRDSLNR